MKTLLALFFLTASLAQAATPEEITERVNQKRLDLAAELIHALDSKAVCDADAYPSTINQLVETAWYQSTEKMKSDFMARIPADSLIRADLAFRNAVGAFRLYGSDLTEEMVATAMVGAKFHAFGRGAYGSPYNVTLQAGGTAKAMSLELLENEPWFKWTESATTWSVRKVLEDGYVTKFLVKIGDKEFTFESRTGEIWLVPVGVKEGDDGFYEDTLSSSDSYCDA